MSEAGRSDHSALDVDIPASYEKASAAFHDAQKTAEEAFDAAINLAKEKMDAANCRHEVELAKMEMQLACCCGTLSAVQRDCSDATGVCHVPSAGPTSSSAFPSESEGKPLASDSRLSPPEASERKYMTQH